MPPHRCAVKLCSGRRCARCAGRLGGTQLGWAASQRPSSNTMYKRSATSEHATSSRSNVSSAAADAPQAPGCQGAPPAGCRCANTTSAASLPGSPPSPSRPRSCEASPAWSTNSAAVAPPSAAQALTAAAADATTTLRARAGETGCDLRRFAQEEACLKPFVRCASGVAPSSRHSSCDTQCTAASPASGGSDLSATKPQQPSRAAW